MSARQATSLAPARFSLAAGSHLGIDELVSHHHYYTRTLPVRERWKEEEHSEDAVTHTA